jgi:L-fuconolactonase
MRPPITRRDFFRAAGAASLAAASTDAIGADSPPLYDGEIVDTHLHLWDLRALRLPWVASATGRAREVLARDFGLADYAEATRGLRVSRAVYMEVDVAEADQVKEAESVAARCAAGGSPMVAAVISGRPASVGFADYLDRFRGNPAIKGLRQVLHNGATPPRFGLEDAFVRGIRTLGERGLSFDLCLRNDQLDVGADLIERCPGTRFVLDHCGNPHAGPLDLEGWRRGMARIAGLRGPEVVCKVSGLYGNVKAEDWPADRLTPIVRTVIDLFGPDRVMFAGDWPVVNLGGSFRVWVDALKRIVRSDRPEAQAKLFRDNALRFYRLS